MEVYAGLDVGFKQTAIAVVAKDGRVIWRGREASQPELLARALAPFGDRLVLAGLETGSLSPWLCRSLTALGVPVVCMDARRAAEAIRSRRIKTDRADAWALAEMLRTGWYAAVHVKSEVSQRWRALLGAREQLIRSKRDLGNQVRGLLRPFGIRISARAGSKDFDAAAREAVAGDRVLAPAIGALLEALARIDSELAELDACVQETARRSAVCWRLTSMPGVGPVTALAFAATIDDVGRFARTRDIGVYLGLTPRHYQSGETDIALGMSRQGDAMARHYLYEAANALLSSVRRSSALKRWGHRVLKRRGAKPARVALARKMACVMARLWRDGAHFEATPA